MKTKLNLLIISLFLFAIGDLHADATQDQIDEMHREEQRLENQRLEDNREAQARQEQKLQQQREESKRLENQRLEREQENKRWNQAHGY